MQSQHLFWATKNYPQKDLPRTFTIGVTSAEVVMIFPDVWYTLLKVPFLGGYEIC